MEQTMLEKKKVGDGERREDVGRETIRRLGQNNQWKRWLKKRSCMPEEGHEACH
jgi:hypothetical protein